MVGGWELVQVPWSELLRADWESDSGAAYNPAQVTGLAFGFNGGAEEDLSGEVWVDDIRWLGTGGQVENPIEAAAPTAAPEEQTQVEQPTPTAQPGRKGGPLPCTGSLGLVLLAGAGMMLFRRNKFLKRTGV